MSARTVPRFWTPERIAELRRLGLLELPLDEQARRLGCTLLAVQGARYRHGLSDLKRSARISSERRRGVPRPPETRERIRAAALALWDDPEHRTRIAPQLARGLAQVKAGVSARALRGFDVPPEHRAVYDDLVTRKGVSASEAAAMLGFLPEGAPIRPRKPPRPATPLASLGRIRTPRGVAGAVARFHGVEPGDILAVGARRLGILIHARMHAIVAVKRRFPALSSPQIARVFGCDHTTILYAFRHWPRIAPRYGLCAPPTNDSTRSL